MSALTDLSQLPIPDVVETLDFETLFTTRKQRFISLYPQNYRQKLPAHWAMNQNPSSSCCRKILT